MGGGVEAVYHGRRLVLVFAPRSKAFYTVRMQDLALTLQTRTTTSSWLHVTSMPS